MATVIALTMVGSLLHAPSSASAAEGDLRALRETAVDYMVSGGPSVRRAAEAALLGSDQDLQAFFDSGRQVAQDADTRAAAQVLASMDGPSTRAAALQALNGSAADVRAFVDGGWETSWTADERLRAYRVLSAAEGPSTKAAAQKALNGSEQDIEDFLSSGREAALYADDRLAATRMLTGGPNNSGPVLNTAAAQALSGSPEELAEFLSSGQFVARARDAELATIRALTEQARQAGEATSRESLAAEEFSTRASNAAEEAKKAALAAQAEAQAAGGAAAKASAAAGRAADAAASAAKAAQEAVAASNAAMRAARTAADASRRAVTAASLTAQAAARAQRAAAAARANAGDARAAREAAEAARDAAARARELTQVKAERDRALAQADASSKAAKAAGVNADAAANAADAASRQSGVSAQQAQRARDAAARARTAAATASRAAGRAEALARSAAQASAEAFSFAEQAATHAENAERSALAAAVAAENAQFSAAESAKAAAAAVESANLAVAAATKATELETLARQEDEVRLTEAAEQGVLAAQEAAAQEQQIRASAGVLGEWNRSLLWDTAEELRVDPATRALLDQAAAPGVTTATMLDQGRRAAVALTSTGGEWTKYAAMDVLTGGEVEMRTWLATGRRAASGQDDRSRVWHLIDTLPDGPQKTAANTALAGDDAAVDAFLRTRNYQGKVANDRRSIYAILDTAQAAGQLTLKAAAERALAGDATAAHDFLRTGQYTARTADERLEVYRVMDAGGPEVKAAGQVALSGPPSYISYFLATSRYQAAQRDLEQAAHVATVRKLILEAQQYAQKALEDAARAQEAALDAAGSAAEADKAAARATAAAQAAEQHRANAQLSAQAAKKSADDAAASAQTARNAANSAQASANSAAKSAATASAASRRASADAAAAAADARDARASATAAGKDAAAADSAAREASAIYATKLKEWEQLQRSTAAGTGPGGTGTAADSHKSWGCLVPESAMSPQCVNVYKDLAGVLTNPAKCSVPANSGTPGCSMLNDLKGFVDENPGLMLDMLQFVLGMCGLVPGAGEVCDAADAAISFGRGDVVGGLLSLGAMVPVVGWLGSGAKALKNSDKLRTIKNIVEQLIKCGSSFTPGTAVLLADGSRRAIEQIRVGDEVLATDPVTGTTAAKAVTALIGSAGVKQLVDVTVDSDGAKGDATGTVTATHNHPFWVRDLGEWVRAESLKPGQSIRTAAGTWVQIESVLARTEVSQVHNLSIADLQTYYVVAGDTPVLVHNAGCPPAIGFSADTVATAYQGMRADGGHAMRRLVGDIVPNVGSNEVKRQAFENITSSILTSPQKTFDWTLGGTGGIRNKGFIGQVNGKTVALFVAKEGEYAGRVTSSKIVTPEDLKLWGICGC
ncbi:polymorphic toxin-type HINT domain-containing protein [Micromonospora sp. DT43]|uniref:polymorphic toxin-type HINT domain-containing protein n=1 Tax=Micromonospora sp. DT43 TaxID=3393440 RepID=UPI003CF29F69